MSVNYQVIPVDESIKNQGFYDWLARWEVECPQQFVLGRYPTINEIKETLNDLENGVVRFSVFGNFPIQRAEIIFAESATEFNIWQAKNGDIDHLSFRGGDYTLLKPLVQRLANVCGTFLVTIEGENPELIYPDQAK